MAFDMLSTVAVPNNGPTMHCQVILFDLSFFFWINDNEKKVLLCLVLRCPIFNVFFACTIKSISHIYVYIYIYIYCIGMDTLKVTPISKAQAKQRMGRAGREGWGVL